MADMNMEANTLDQMGQLALSRAIQNIEAARGPQRGVTKLAQYAHGMLLRGTGAVTPFHRSDRPWLDAIEKAATGAATAADLRGSGDYRDAWDEFVGRLISMSAVDAMKPSMLRGTIRKRVGVLTVADGAIVGERGQIPVSAITVGGTGMSPVKAAAIVVMTNESLEELTAVRLVERELLKAVAVPTNLEFLSGILTDSDAIESTAAGAADILAEIESLLAIVATTATEDLFLIVAPAIANKLATMGTTGGDRAFPQMTPRGGQIAGITTLVSGQVPSDSTGSNVILVNAGRIVYDDYPVELAPARSAMLEMSTIPEDESGALVSLFQTDSTALRATRTFAYHVLGDAVAHLIGVNWGESS